MTKSKKSIKTEKNYAKVQNFIRMGCSTSEIAKFMNLTYNQAWYLRKDTANHNQRQALENSNVKQILSAKPNAKARVSKRTVAKREVTVQPENIKVSKTGTGLTITVTIAI
jgi:hypothetical protein